MLGPRRLRKQKTYYISEAAVLEQAAIAGALNPDILADAERAATVAATIARRLDALAGEYDRGWTGAALEDGSLVFSRTLRGSFWATAMSTRATTS